MKRPAGPQDSNALGPDSNMQEPATVATTPAIDVADEKKMKSQATGKAKQSMKKPAAAAAVSYGTMRYPSGAVAVRSRPGGQLFQVTGKHIKAIHSVL